MLVFSFATWAVIERSEKQRKRTRTHTERNRADRKPRDAPGKEMGQCFERATRTIAPDRSSNNKGVFVSIPAERHSSAIVCSRPYRFSQSRTGAQQKSNDYSIFIRHGMKITQDVQHKTRYLVESPVVHQTGCTPEWRWKKK